MTAARPGLGRSRLGHQGAGAGSGVLGEAVAVGLLRAMLEIPSPSYHEAALAGPTAEAMLALGFDAGVDGFGNVVGRIGRGGGPTVLLLGQLDTVPGDVPVRSDRGRLYGRGAVAAKGPLAAMICAAAEAAHRDATFVVVGAVEGETPGVRGAVAALRTFPPPDAVLVGAPSGWSGVVVGNQGRLDLRYSVRRPGNPASHTAPARAGAGDLVFECWHTVRALLGQRPWNRVADGETARDSAEASLVSFRGDPDRAELDFALRVPSGFDGMAFIDALRQRLGIGRLTLLGSYDAWAAAPDDAAAHALRAGILRQHGRPVLISDSAHTAVGAANAAARYWRVPMAAYGPGDAALVGDAEEHIMLADYLRGIAVLSEALRALSAPAPVAGGTGAGLRAAPRAADAHPLEPRATSVPDRYTDPPHGRKEKPMSEILRRLERLPEDQRAQLIARLRAEARAAEAAGPAPRADPGSAPLSLSQEPLWSYDQLVPGSATYNIPVCTRVRGPLDVPALRSALADVVARHEALRTALADDGDGPRQFVADAVAVELPVVRVEGADPAEREAAALAAVRTEAAAGFELDRAPLWRARVYRLDDEDHLFLFTVHHSVFDGWSLGVFNDELGALYRAARNGEPADLPAPPTQYGDFAIWQRERVSGERLERLSSFWRGRLADAPVLDFAGDRPRPGRPSYRGANAELDIPQETLRAADALARQCGTTPFTVFTAAFLATLRGYTGQDDLVIGSAHANRQHSSVERVIGFFVNQLVLRCDLSGDPDFRELLERVRGVLRDAAEHGELPFGLLIDAAGAPRDPSRQPGYQVGFTVEEVADPVRLDGARTEDVELFTGTSKFDLVWNLKRAAGRAKLAAEYATDLFDADTVLQFARHYAELLDRVCADPSARLSQASKISAAERAELVALGSGPARPVRELTVPQIFEQQAARTPDAVALVVSGAQYTYAELDARADRVARRLAAAGIGVGDVVALALPRSAELIAALLGVLKAGAAYLPLDLGSPPARLAAILDDAAPAAVLTDADTAGRLPEGRALIRLDEAAGDEAAGPADPVRSAAASSSTAYILYTSGSTGKPKGVLINHRAVVKFIDSVTELFELTAADRVLGFAALGFDVSVFEIFSALLNGARLYLATDEERLSIEAVQRLLAESGITVIDLPPTVLTLMDPAPLDRLRIVFVGGEAFSAQLVNQWNPGRRLFNGYGPTECTVTMIVQECAGTWQTTPPIGLPMADHVAHVLDGALDLVPRGVPGELVIGGIGLSDGYLNRPRLNEEKFVADPFGTAPGGRLYRTGDLVKRLADGRIVFLGRIDRQVKIRGLRIELGEVEAAAASFPGIGRVAVEPWTDPAGEKHLVAYLSPGAGAAGLDQGGVREHMAARLPRYMLPAFFVTLPELPLNSSGKIDRRALPEPDAAPAAPPAPPRTETERALVEEILAPLLRRERVGVFDDFFQLGGNSLQATQLISAINRRFEVRVPLADFFLSPTPAGLAAAVDAQRVERMSEDELMAMLESMPDEEVRARLREDGA